jgi:hypothetical protein
MKRLSLVFGLAVALLLPAAVWGGSYTFETITNPADPNFTQLLGINNSSVIAGYFGDGAVVPNNGFTLVLPGTFTPENFPGSVQTQVVGINGPGETVGFYIDTAGVSHGFTDIGGLFTSVSNPNTTTVTQLLGVNNAGVAAGYWTDAAGNFHPFTFSGGTFTGISFAGLVSAQATDINNAGWVTGFNMTSATTSQGFLDIGGMFTFLLFPGSVFTQALGLNNDGEVVGSYVDSGGVTHGFTYNITTKTYTSVDAPGAVGTTIINGVNDQGQLVGFFTTGAIVDGVTVTDGFVTTPEPGSLALLGTGLIAIAFKFRKQPA